MAATISSAQTKFPGESDHQCTFCDFKATLKSKLEYHVRQHIKEKPFFCNQCSRGFSIKGNLQMHISRVHHGIKPVHDKKYNCSFCPYVSHKRHTMEIHTRRHTEGRRFPCQQPNCQYAAKSSNELELHITAIHSEERKYFCQFPNCGYRGKTSIVLRQHYKTHSDLRPFVCDVPQCNYRAKRKDSLRIHKLGVHNGGFKPFACSTCSHRTTSKLMLRRHELTHSKVKPIKCIFSGCTFSCKTKARLSDHKENRHTERKFKCNFTGCLSSAASRAKLELHKKHVHYEKAHQCPHCDYRTALLSNLQKHIELHKGIRLIPCPINGCTFKSKSLCYINKHVSFHKANLACPIKECSCVCKTRSGLKRHLKTHDPTGRPFHCLLCPKFYYSNSSLQAHLKSHTREKPFQCPVCDYGSVRTKDIKSHVRTYHSNLLTEFVCDEKFICNHCCVNFGSAIGLVLHTIKLKSAVIVLTRLQIKFSC